MDEIDQASGVCQFMSDVGISNARSALQSRELEVSGFCHNCGELLESPLALFCDLDCAEDWEKIKRAKAQNIKGK